VTLFLHVSTFMVVATGDAGVLVGVAQIALVVSGLPVVLALLLLEAVVLGPDDSDLLKLFLGDFVRVDGPGFIH
jgi:hypothetical protein